MIFFFKFRFLNDLLCAYFAQHCPILTCFDFFSALILGKKVYLSLDLIKLMQIYAFFHQVLQKNLLVNIHWGSSKLMKYGPSGLASIARNVHVTSKHDIQEQNKLQREWYLNERDTKKAYSSHREKTRSPLWMRLLHKDMMKTVNIPNKIRCKYCIISIGQEVYKQDQNSYCKICNSLHHTLTSLHHTLTEKITK